MSDMTQSLTTTLPQRTRAVLEYLIQCALEARTITYGELGHETGIPTQGPWPQLEAIHKLCLERDLPWLTALVVRKDTRLPGADWTGTWADGTPLEVERVWRMAVAQVIAFTGWKNVVL